MFLSACHFLNTIGLSWLVAAIRFVLVSTVFRGVRTKLYSQPENVGYLGWIEHRWFGPLAFMRLDGSFQVRW